MVLVLFMPQSLQLRIGECFNIRFFTEIPSVDWKPYSFDHADRRHREDIILNIIHYIMKVEFPFFILIASYVIRLQDQAAVSWSPLHRHHRHRSIMPTTDQRWRRPRTRTRRVTWCRLPTAASRCLRRHAPSPTSSHRRCWWHHPSGRIRMPTICTVSDRLRRRCIRPHPVCTTMAATSFNSRHRWSRSSSRARLQRRRQTSTNGTRSVEHRHRWRPMPIHWLLQLQRLVLQARELRHRGCKDRFSMRSDEPLPGCITWSPSISQATITADVHWRTGWYN